MTDNQKKYIQYLDSECKRKGLATRSTDEDLLGADWEEYYKNYTIDYATEVIVKLKKALGLSVNMVLGGKKK